MRNDLRPLCPGHNSQMVSAHFWLQLDSDTYPKFCYACEQPGCSCCYDIVQGYLRFGKVSTFNAMSDLGKIVRRKGCQCSSKRLTRKGANARGVVD
jgi:hypothetical protein